MHALITAFIPWNVIHYYWRLATNETSYIVWIANAQVRHTAVYMAKYITKDLTSTPFRKDERRYGMSKGMRMLWPHLKSVIEEPDKQNLEFVYKPDNSNLLRQAALELREQINKREKWQDETSLKNSRKKRLCYKPKQKRRPKHDNRMSLSLDDLTIFLIPVKNIANKSTYYYEIYD